MDEIVQPKPAVRFEISKSLNGNKIVYIARDHGGVVRLRSENLANLEKLISEYRLPEPPKPLIDKEAVVSDQIDALVETIVEVQNEEEKKKPAKKTASSSASSKEDAETAEVQATEEKKEFLKNELKETIEEQKDKTEKKSFWDKLR